MRNSIMFKNLDALTSYIRCLNNIFSLMYSATKEAKLTPKII